MKMFSFMSEVQKSAAQRIGIWIGAAIVGLPVYSAYLCIHALLSATNPTAELQLAKTQLMQVAAWSLPTIVLSTLLIIYLLRKEKLILRFGVLWDTNRQPYCAVHKVGLRNPGEWGTFGFGLECRQCFSEKAPKEAESQKYIRLVDDDGNNITLSDARQHCLDRPPYVKKP